MVRGVRGRRGIERHRACDDFCSGCEAVSPMIVFPRGASRGDCLTFVEFDPWVRVKSYCSRSSNFGVLPQSMFGSVHSRASEARRSVESTPPCQSQSFPGNTITYFLFIFCFDSSFVFISVRRVRIVFFHIRPIHSRRGVGFTASEFISVVVGSIFEIAKRHRVLAA